MITRRRLLSGSAALPFMLAGSVSAQPYVDAGAFGLGDGAGDQSTALEIAIDAAASLGQVLALRAGTYEISNLRISRAVTLRGNGETILRLGEGDSILAIVDCADVTLEGLIFEGPPNPQSGDTALLDLTQATRISIRDCVFRRADGIGVRVHDAGGRIEASRFSDIADTAIFATDSRGLDLLGNAIGNCGNGGIRIWRQQQGFDGSRLTGNRIDAIDWRAGGNGQNGNGINIFRADGVSIFDNSIADCAFSAIRLNATDGTRVIGNHCIDSGEVSIFSEFGFSGSIISDNLVEGGAAGISMTNFDRGGRMSLCKGNIVRNLAKGSRTNPGVVPYGIAAEADTIVQGNIVEAVPGTGINVGWGPYLRDVLVSDNLVRDCDTGISVSVAPGAGHARIEGNVVSGSRRHAIVGAQWDKIVSTDLVADAARYTSIAIGANSVL
ncbi:MAG: hypothetical protein ABS75_32300 [Pelagibacterium sp. SCN 63-23]|nr:MAG: hypothetical protein ABS75_32300 [Pelagibacterium sp. SCN 63-23]